MKNIYETCGSRGKCTFIIFERNLDDDGKKLLKSHQNNYYSFKKSEDYLKALRRLLDKIKQMKPGIKEICYTTPDYGNFYVDDNIVQEYLGSWSKRTFSEYKNYEQMAVFIFDLLEFGYCYPTTGINILGNSGVKNNPYGIDFSDITIGGSGSYMNGTSIGFKD